MKKKYIYKHFDDINIFLYKGRERDDQKKKKNE